LRWGILPLPFAQGLAQYALLARCARVWYDDEAGGKLVSGPVAQLGARLHGMQKVRGSNPLRSTNEVFVI
jgi:hypothetical protein